MATAIANNDAEMVSRSPSPPPPPPQDSTPGIRATALQNSFNGALNATLRKCSYDNFASCFPTTAMYRPETLEGFWKQFVGKLNEVCKAEFETILADRAVVPSLNSLDRLVSEAKARKEAAEAAALDGKVDVPVPPHTLPVPDLFNAHLSPFLLDQQSALSSALSTIQASNTTLVEKISEQRAEMEALVNGLEAVVADLERSAAMLQADEVQSLTSDVRMIEEELKG